MKNWMYALWLVAFGSLASSMYMYKALDSERARTQALQAHVASLKEQRVQPQQPPAAAKPAPEVKAADSEGPSPAEATGQAEMFRPAPGTVAAGSMPPALDHETIRQARQRAREMLADPKYRAAMLSQQRRGLRHMYPRVAEELELSREQANALMDLLAEQQIRQHEAMPDFDPSSSNSVVTWHDNQRKQNEREIQALLGTEKYAAWQDYQRTMPARFEVRQIEDSLAAAGLPLESEQYKQLVSAIQREHDNSMRDLPGQSGENRVMFQAHVNRGQAMRSQLEWQEQRHRRMIDAASGILTAEQLDYYRQQLEDEMTMQRAQQQLVESHQSGIGALAVASPGVAFRAEASLAVPVPATEVVEVVDE